MRERKRTLRPTRSSGAVMKRVISETADRVNDTYLRVNGQAEGVKSYDRMVDLIVAYFRDKV